MELNVENLFCNLWSNKAYSESIDFIEDTNQNEMLTPKSVVCLLDFLMV